LTVEVKAMAELECQWRYGGITSNPRQYAMAVMSLVEMKYCNGAQEIPVRL